MVVEKGSASCGQLFAEDTLKYSSGIRSILHDSAGNYWFGSHQEGVARFDGTTFTYFMVEDGLSDNQVRTIQEGDNDVIWFGTANGVSSFYDGNVIQRHLEDAITNEPLPQEKKSIRTSDLWFNGGNSSGFFGTDGAELNFLPFNHQFDKDKYGPFSFCVTDISKPRLEYGWISTYSAVFGYDGEAFKVIDDDFINFFGDFGSLHVRSILEDSKGNLWIGNNGIGVLLYDGKKVSSFSDEKDLIHPKSSKNGERSPEGTMEHVFAIFEDQDGNIWFGDRDTGAWRYDGEEMTNFIVDPNLGTQMIWQIYQDQNGQLLFAMANGGVYAFNGNSFDRKF